MCGSVPSRHVTVSDVFARQPRSPASTGSSGSGTLGRHHGARRSHQPRSPTGSNACGSVSLRRCFSRRFTAQGVFAGQHRSPASTGSSGSGHHGDDIMETSDSRDDTTDVLPLTGSLKRPGGRRQNPSDPAPKTETGHADAVETQLQKLPDDLTDHAPPRGRACKDLSLRAAPQHHSTREVDASSGENSGTKTSPCEKNGNRPRKEKRKPPTSLELVEPPSSPRKTPWSMLNRWGGTWYYHRKHDDDGQGVEDIERGE